MRPEPLAWMVKVCEQAAHNQKYRIGSNSPSASELGWSLALLFLERNTNNLPMLR
jgi:hypothetical protein